MSTITLTDDETAAVINALSEMRDRMLDPNGSPVVAALAQISLMRDAEGCVTIGEPNPTQRWKAFSDREIVVLSCALDADQEDWTAKSDRDLCRGLAIAANAEIETRPGLRVDLGLDAGTDA